MKKQEILDEDTGKQLATITVGNNASENDELFEAAEQTDTWFHLNNLPSAHVWLHYNLPEKSVSLGIQKNLIIKCSSLVKENSKCNKDAYVCYLQKKSLKKDYTKKGAVFLLKRPNLTK